MNRFFSRLIARFLCKIMEADVNRTLRKTPLKIPDADCISPAMIDNLVSHYIALHIDKRAFGYDDIIRSIVVKSLCYQGYTIVDKQLTDTVESPFCFERQTQDSSSNPKVEVPRWVGD